MSDTKTGGVEAAGDEEEAGPAAKGRLSVLWSLGLALFVVGGGCLAIATPKFAAARTRANERACFANQKTLEGAIEMYQRDFDRYVDDLAAVGPELVKKGYLQSYPSDPGQGEGSSGNYRLEGGYHPGCAAHPGQARLSCDACAAVPKNSAGVLSCVEHGVLPSRRRPR